MRNSCNQRGGSSKGDDDDDDDDDDDCACSFLPACLMMQLDGVMICQVFILPVACAACLEEDSVASKGGKKS
jgi:hypothetical protein